MSAYLEAENNNGDLIKPWLMALFESLPKEEERYTRSPARITYSLKRLVFEQKIHELVTFSKERTEFWECHTRDFWEVQTVKGIFYPISRAACEALSLLGDDKEWDIAIQEACAFATPTELRSLLAHIILHCDITNPSKLWTKYWKEMSRDMPEKVSQTVQIPDYRLNDDGLQGYTLYEIEVVLNNHGKSNLQEIIFVYGYGENDPENTSWIDIPPTYCMPPDNQGLSKLIDFIYDQSTLQTPSAITLQQKAIVCPKNETADIINLKVLDMVNGERTIYVRQDEAVSVKNDKAESEMLYPVEHLNTLKLPRFPPHQLELKVKAPIMLLRNVNLIGGLCNGTRMIVRQLMTKLNEV
nr:DNA helicase [Tanacetum cinerariifolium]